ncbi:MAG TPA: isoprenyl transferase [Candidatus Pseudogracilibacillus intestinigallinarum]|uniref:Isoprenyl transferase n=1 Tax=Candidatus Pseudogracilibacillus intestinigallinarum TaxID=2838742 RepID=A0A9D1PNZ3_9BACI|nr:isoprenyl transferase [Candidatus Pseudogracilibacillus intestinigallinarum]
MSKWMPFFNKNEKEIQTKKIDNVPNHVAIIMDGNGRWASERGLPRIAGHKEGMEVVRRIVKEAVEQNIKVLTLYAFSTENWKRPKREIDFLMRLPIEFSNKYLPEMIENNVRIKTIGEFDSLPAHTKRSISHAKEKTKQNDGLLLNFALNYGSRDEIVRATKQVIQDVHDGTIAETDIDEAVIAKYLYTEDVPDPDLLIRTSGEHRLSNFLLWQLAYAEFWFTDVMWPDFNEQIFLDALKDYQKRKRRYGGI